MERAKTSSEVLANKIARMKSPEIEKRQKGGRPSNDEVARKAIREGKTQQYFNRILSDEVEQKLWNLFMTGNTDGALGDLGGMEGISPVCWAAFKRAVEYKRGLPQQQIPDEMPNAVRVTLRLTGASTEFFAEQVKKMGYKTIDALPEAPAGEKEEPVEASEV